MSEPLFDLTYQGLIAPGADPEETRARLCAIFKLSPADSERLFSGQSVSVKRGVDARTAERYEQVFAKAGALLTVMPLGNPEDLAELDRPEPPTERRGKRQGEPHPEPIREPSPPRDADAADDGPATNGYRRPGRRIDISHLSLAPLGEGGWLEQPVPVKPIMLNIGWLSLVPGDDWTLEDCQPPPTPIPIPDLSWLALIPLPPRDDSDNPTPP